MRGLIGFECSGAVRDAFIAMGHDVISCDIKPCETGSKNHYQGDIFDIINDGFDFGIFHPPCTRLTVTGNRWYKPEYADRYPNIHQERQEAIELFMKIVNCKIPRKAIENPVGIMSSIYRKPDQIIQPWMFGDSYQKQTCLWLTNLPKLVHIKQPDLFNDTVTHVDKGEFLEWTNAKGVKKRQALWYSNAKKEDRSTIRSRTFPGIANAMALQWNF